MLCPAPRIDIPMTTIGRAVKGTGLQVGRGCMESTCLPELQIPYLLDKPVKINTKKAKFASGGLNRGPLLAAHLCDVVCAAGGRRGKYKEGKLFRPRHILRPRLDVQSPQPAQHLLLHSLTGLTWNLVSTW